MAIFNIIFNIVRYRLQKKQIFDKMTYTFDFYSEQTIRFLFFTHKTFQKGGCQWIKTLCFELLRQNGASYMDGTDENTSLPAGCL